MREKIIQSVLFLLLLLLVGFVYRPGLSGPFLFDDFHNIDALGSYGGVTNWESLKAFVFSGAAGPSGRPIALASFLLNDQYWPSHPASFKYTNLMLHLLVGVGLFWACLKLLRLLAYEESIAIWVGLLASALWVLHPYFVSTTLYVVQRMTQLAALFSIYGIVAYLHGRGLLLKSPAKAYAWMSAALVAGTVLATLSKENGALLPVLILVVESSIPGFGVRDKLLQFWKVIFLWLPTLAIFVYLGSLIDFSSNPWPNRPFNQIERLCTEALIVVEYLYDLMIPKFEGRGLYQDGFDISKGLLDPPKTLAAGLILVVIFVFSFVFRKRYPFVFLAVFFFLSGHLLESTVVGLELYFEHRNYLPAAFLFLPLANFIVGLSKRHSNGFSVSFALILIAFLSFMTFQRASLWSGGYRLISYWALQNPDSPRAQNGLAQIMIESGRADEALALLENSVNRMPDSAMLTTSLLALKVADNSATEADFSWAGEQLARQPFDAQAVKGIYTLVDFVTEESRCGDYAELMIKMLGRVSENDRYMRFPLFQRFLPFQRGRLLLCLAEPEQAKQEFELAMRLYGNIDSAMEMVAQTAHFGFYSHALALLDSAEILFNKQADRTLRRSRMSYQIDIERIRRQLLQDRAGETK